MDALLLLCLSACLAGVVAGVLGLAQFIKERRHMAILQDDLDEAERRKRFHAQWSRVRGLR